MYVWNIYIHFCVYITWNIYFWKDATKYITLLHMCVHVCVLYMCICCICVYVYFYAIFMRVVYVYICMWNIYLCFCAVYVVYILYMWVVYICVCCVYVCVIYAYMCVHVHVYLHCICKRAEEKRTLGVLIYPTPPYSLRWIFSLNEQLSRWTKSPSRPLVSVSHSATVTGPWSYIRLLCARLDLNSGTHHTQHCYQVSHCPRLCFILYVLYIISIDHRQWANHFH